jgi:anaerobic ribonucleoside-triphosphate reductase activating protein
MSHVHLPETTILVAGIVNDTIVDGPGLRIALYMQGCDKDCPGCHNPEAREMTGGTPYEASALFETIEANPLTSGVTFSGGEPLLQAGALTPLAEKIKGKGLELAMYTGDVFEDIFQRGNPEELALLSLVDVLIDGPFLLEERSLTLSFRGSRNQRILDSKASIKAGHGISTTDPRWHPID